MKSDNKSMVQTYQNLSELIRSKNPILVIDTRKIENGIAKLEIRIPENDLSKAYYFIYSDNNDQTLNNKYTTNNFWEALAHYEGLK